MFTYSTESALSVFYWKGKEARFEVEAELTTSFNHGLHLNARKWKNQHGVGVALHVSLFVFDLDISVDLL